jgi:hypothetical protein
MLTGGSSDELRIQLDASVTISVSPGEVAAKYEFAEQLKDEFCVAASDTDGIKIDARKKTAAD